MTLRFSTAGPAFPEQLVDALLTGDVVFLCGAGISAPQLPGFQGLVERCFEALNVEMSPSEGLSFEAGRYEEVLGSLSRRIVDATEMNRTVVQLLQPTAEPDLANHRTILRLSRDLENRPSIVTTNFDTLLEKASAKTADPAAVRAMSFAGQDLPPPGSAGFGGIIHLHGRIGDPPLGLEQTPLVITSADYGDAYMRSGWASRFLFDLSRCKTIVLVGYSAGDAPVRYFLNVLEADRERFPDLRPVYALDAVDARADPDLRWGALGVEPIAYEYTVDATTGEKSHSALWDDLHRLADLIERPKATRREWARQVLAKPFSEADPAELDRASWLLNGRRDLWDIVIAAVEDAAWLDFFADRKLWSESDAPWVVAAWMARDFQSAERFRRAISWWERLGRPFADEIARRLRQVEGLPEPWLRAWRLLAISRPIEGNAWEDRSYAVRETLRGPLTLYADLQKAVDLLSPVLELTANRDYFYGEPAPDPPQRLADLAWMDLSVADRGGAPELLDAIAAVPLPCTIMDIATAKLQTVIGLSLDIEAIDGDYDRNDFAVPSVEPHEQNDHHDGPIFLVQLLARLLPAAAEANPAAARRHTEIWRAMPGIVGLRLWLHALRHQGLFSATEAMEALMSVPRDLFWHVRRELALVLRERAAEADPDVVARIEQRILTEGPEYYARYPIDAGQADWRDHARDAEVWLRLNMLSDAGVISEAGLAELAAIKARREYLDRAVEDSDFFSVYSTGVRTVAGDAQPIIDAADNERLQVAHDVLQSRDIEKQAGWSAFCRADPRGAFDALGKGALDAANAPLWRDLIRALAFQEGGEATRRDIVVGIFAALEPATDAFLALIVHQVADLYWSSPRREVPAIAAWWPRLFAIAVAHDTEQLDPTRDLYEEAINSPAGRLTQAALLDIEHQRKAGNPIDQQLLDAIGLAAAAGGRQGALARAALVRAAGFVLTIKGEPVTAPLDAALSGDGAEAVALRAVLVSDASQSITASRTFGAHLLRGLIEFRGRGRDAATAAAKILAPPLSVLRGDRTVEDWGLTAADAAKVLRNGPPALREGAAEVLKQWIGQLAGGPAATWRQGIGPLLARVWPRERALREKAQTRHFADLAVASGDAFPEALEQLSPYLTRLEGHGGTFAIKKSQAPERFPRETLELLWRLFGPGSSGELHGVPEILDRLIAAEPAIELDRRLQWLEQRAVRYE